MYLVRFTLFLMLVYNVRLHVVWGKFDAQDLLFKVGGVAQWLGRQSLAGGLSLICVTSPTQPSIPPGSVNAITWITGEKTIKWQTRLRMAG